MASRRPILSLDRRSHPGPRLDWRWSDATERIQQQPESHVKIIVFPCQVNLVMSRAASEIRFFFTLVSVEVTTAVGRHGVDPASVFLIQKETGAILASSRCQSPNLANLAAIHHDRSRARQQVIESEFDRITVPEVFGDPLDIRREQKPGMNSQLILQALQSHTVRSKPSSVLRSDITVAPPVEC